MARTKEFDEGAVLDRAIELFTRKGYNGTSAQDLVDELGISRSSLYDTFGDKRTLFMKAINRYQERNAGEMIAYIEQSNDVVATIRHIFKTALSDMLHNKNPMGCLIVNSTVEMAPHDPEVAELLQANMHDVEDALYRAIKKGQDTGQVSTKNTARALARFFFNTLSGIRITAKTAPNKKACDDVIDVALSTLR